MVTQVRTYAPTLAETARLNIEAVALAIMDHTGLSQTFVSKLCRSDSAFLTRLPETTMNITTYDVVMGRLSAIFPEDAIWPEAVPRPAPGEVPADLAEELSAKLARIAAKTEPKKPRRASLRERFLLSNTAGGDQAPAHS